MNYISDSIGEVPISQGGSC